MKWWAVIHASAFAQRLHAGSGLRFVGWVWIGRSDWERHDWFVSVWTGTTALGNSRITSSATAVQIGPAGTPLTNSSALYEAAQPTSACTGQYKSPAADHRLLWLPRSVFAKKCNLYRDDHRWVFHQHRRVLGRDAGSTWPAISPRRAPSMSRRSAHSTPKPMTA